MDYEKAYKEALSKANKYYNANTNNGYREIFEDIFHELKESEDERIRKEIIQSIQDNMCVIHKDKCIAWLEKQGEQKPIEQDTETHDLWVYIREWNDKFGRLPKDEDEFASCIDYVMKRQKPSNKVEPKFKVGDCIINSTNNIYKVLHIINDEYRLSYNTDGSVVCAKTKTIDKKYHLWTIQDAKKGNILQANKCTLIFDSLTKDIDGNTVISSWYFCDTKKFYGMGTSQSDLWSIEGVVPATKEQCDILFQKMKEAGYEWDADKKELKKIEQESTWNEKYIADVFEKVGLARIVREQGNDQLTNAVQAAMIELSKQHNPAWSEEDERAINDITVAISMYANGEIPYTLPSQLLKDVERLKSIKPNHWKPSEEQIKALRWVLNNIPYNQSKEEISELLEQLKKL